MLGFVRNNLSDILFTTLTVQKLNKQTRKKFKLSKNALEPPNFDFNGFFRKKKSISPMH